MSLLTAGTDTQFTTELTHLHPRMGDKTDVYGVLVGKPVGGEPLGRPRRRWEDNTLKWIFEKWVRRTWTGSNWLWIGTVGGIL